MGYTLYWCVVCLRVCNRLTMIEGWSVGEVGILTTSFYQSHRQQRSTLWSFQTIIIVKGFLFVF